jgi:hypothetical protein
MKGTAPLSSSASVPEGAGAAGPTGNGAACAPNFYKLAGPAPGQTSAPLFSDALAKHAMSNEAADMVFSAWPRGASAPQGRELLASRAGFTKSQSLHEKASAKHFKALDWLNVLLGE